ncbi:MAG TPA: hypothetical protein VFW11_15600, partial [Cyclobacteriaceae bacterium]|nr:hypothetical protein [Cyclobacteriaceae bacterium]
TDDEARAAVVAQAVQFANEHKDNAQLQQTAQKLLEDEINQQNEDLKKTLGIGWYWDPIRKELSGVSALFIIGWIGTKLLGWIISAYAITIGAPFWFDMLKKVIQIRNAGVKPEEKK